MLSPNLLVPCLWRAGFAQEPPCTGQLIGTLPTLNHEVGGDLYVESEYTFCIENFTYDGQGPGESE